MNHYRAAVQRELQRQATTRRHSPGRPPEVPPTAVPVQHPLAASQPAKDKH